jgi:predicted transcriptional regulator
MRTTIDLDDELLREVKMIAARTGRRMNEVIRDAVRESVARRKQPARTQTPMPRFNGGPPFPGVDLNSSSALFDLEDSDDKS